MRVAYILGSLNTGGLETLSLDIFSNQNLKRIELIGIHRKKGNLYNQFVNTSIPLYEIKLNKLNPFLYLHKLRKMFIEFDIMIIHAHTLMDAISCYLAMVGLKSKLIVSLHGRYTNTNFFQNRLLGFLFKKADNICFVSHAQKATYMKGLNLKENPNITVLYNGISFSKFDFAEKPDLRKQLNINDKSLILGTTGNFTSVKDQMTICRFLKLLKDRSVNFQFVFVGGKSKSEPEKFDKCYNYCVANNLNYQVHFLGTRNDVPSILKCLDAFIYSSAFDTFGISLIEALYMNIPVFVNDIDVMMEVTGNGKYVELFKTGDEKDLFYKFEKIVLKQNFDFLKYHSAVEFVKKNYSIEMHLNRLIQIYLKLVS